MKKFAEIQALEGGFVVTLDDKSIVTTSLNKAIKLVRDFLVVLDFLDGGAEE